MLLSWSEYILEGFGCWIGEASRRLLVRLTLGPPNRLWRLRVEILGNPVGTLGRRSRGDGFEPTFKGRILIQLQAEQVVGCRPAIGGDVRHRIATAGKPGPVLQAPIEHAEEASRFLRVALDRDRDFLR